MSYGVALESARGLFSRRMHGPPIPQRIPPLAWRRPAFLWTPLALTLAIGWPAGLFTRDSAIQRLALVVGAAAFAIALVSLGASWLIGRAPRARRVVVLHVVIAGALASLAAPFILSQILAALAAYQGAGAGEIFAMAVSMAPLTLVLGLPIALVSGVVFAWVALARRRPGDASAPRLSERPLS